MANGPAIVEVGQVSVIAHRRCLHNDRHVKLTYRNPQDVPSTMYG